MRILVINSGSSTVKFQLIESLDKGGELRGQKKLARGLVDRIDGGASYRFELRNGTAVSKSAAVDDHRGAVRLILDWLGGTLRQATLDAVGHRVVHGGGEFNSAVLISDGVLARIDALSELAPLHNPPAVSGIRAARTILGSSIPMVAVFDTSFHHTIPDQAATYAIPHDLAAKHRLRRYGFHGIAHRYSMLRYGELTGTPHDQISMVTLHLGNGCSATAIRGGQSVDTSMGFTPLEGLVMGTRSGDLDPALVSYLVRKEGVDAAAVETWLNKRSGLFGVSGVSNDMRELIAMMEQSPRCRLAVEVFCYRARKYLGAYLAVLGGAQAVVFSGGIGENSPLVREKICQDMEWCGLRLDRSLNSTVAGRDGEVSAPGSRLKVYVIHTDEEAIIAGETAALVERK